jgi:hypothetical protein
MPVTQPIFRSNPVAPSCHAATIVEAAPGRFLAAWFAGTYEGHPDVAIWLARCERDGWSEPATVADEPGVSHYNPLLFRDRAGTLWLFYKIGVSVPTWTGMYRTSVDGGHTWSVPTMLPAGLIGPAKNKPITLSNGDILCGTSHETWGSWACWVEASSDGGRRWAKHGPIAAPGAGRYDAGTETAVSAVWDEATGVRRRHPTHPVGVRAGSREDADAVHAAGRVRLRVDVRRLRPHVVAGGADIHPQPQQRAGRGSPAGWADRVGLQSGPGRPDTAGRACLG